MNAAMVAWLRDALNTLEAMALEVDETEQVWHVENADEVWAERFDDGLVEVPIADSMRHAEYIAKHDPRAVLARVEAERAIVEEHGPDYSLHEPHCSTCGDVPQVEWPCSTITWLAYGHRHDIIGYDPSWAPALLS